MSSFKTYVFYDIAIASIIATVTSVWIYVIGDSPVKFEIALIIGFCCGIATFFILNNKNLTVNFSRHNLPIKQLLIILFILFVLSYFSSPIDRIFVADWFSLSWLNVFSFILSSFFSMFVPGLILLHLIGAYQKLELSASIILSVIISMFFTAIFWFSTRILSLTSSVSFGLFAISQFILLILYLVKSRNSPSKANQSFFLKLNVVVPLAAIIAIFVSLIFLQEFVYEPFLRGDSWDYVGTALAINKGAFNVAPAGKFYILAAPNFFETFVSSLTALSDFPPVNSLLALSLLMAVLLPAAFYVMCVKYTKNSTIGLLSTLLFVVASGFGWIPFIFEKLSQGLSYSPVDFAGAVEINAPEVLFDITQPHGVLSEGLKTYAFGVLAIIMLIYLFETNLPSKVRVSLIAILTAFTFQIHVEEAIIFSLAFVPVFLLLSRGEKTYLRQNLVGVIFGLIIAASINLAFYSQVTNVVSVSLLAIAALGLFYAFSYIKIDTLQKVVRDGLMRHRLLIFSLFCYFFVLCVYTLLSFGFPNMTDNYSMAVVFEGFSFPWYYYPMSLGIVGILLLIGLLMDYPKDRKISTFWLMVVSLIVFGVLLSFFNEYVFSTGTKEWRVIYRNIPIAASVVGGWVIFNILKLGKKNLGYDRRLHKLLFNTRIFSTVILLLVIVLGIPSTIIASEYWMSSGLNPRGNIHPQTQDIELSSFFMNVPFTSRAAVLSGGPNALARLAGTTTANSEIYLNITELSRPETIAMVSSDVRYIVVEKTNEVVFPLLRYLSVVFSNSKYVVYSMPNLAPPVAESTVGYISPLSYDHPSYAAFLLMASLNIPYEVATNDFYNKSTLILPQDFSEKLDDSQASQIKDWVNEGGDLVVFGGNGILFEDLGLAYDERSSSAADSISLGSANFRFNETVTLSKWTFDEQAIDVLGYYQFREQNVCPFAVHKGVGKGSVLYLNLDPLYNAINMSYYGNLFDEDVMSVVKGSLGDLGLAALPVNSGQLSVSDRWLAHYTSYAKNDFWAYGNVTIQSTVSGSYLIPNGTKTSRLIINQANTQEYSNLVIYNISIEGKASLEIYSESLVSSNQPSIPIYFPLQLEKCSIDISSSNEVINIQTDKGNFKTSDVTLVLSNASLIVKRPIITVTGLTHFRKISLPTLSSPWSENVDLLGKTTKFAIGYGDVDYVFFEQFSSPIWKPNGFQLPSISLQDLFLSPFNLSFLILLGTIFVVSTKRQVK